MKGCGSAVSGAEFDAADGRSPLQTHEGVPTMSEFIEAPATPAFQNRTTLLVTFGVIQICLGLLAGLLAVLVIIAGLATITMMEEAAAQQGMQAGSIVMGGLIYGLIGAWFISMGYGSFKARRWARSLTLAASWIGLVCGGLGTLSMLFFMGDMMEQMERQGHMPPGSGKLMAVVMFMFSFVIYILIPGTLLLIYGGKNVKATCEYTNPEPSWTDACPLPVLIQAVLLGSYSLLILSMAAYHWATPFFGTVLTGVPGAVAILSFALCCAVLARGCYRLHPLAWWGTIAMALFWGTSAFLTFSRGDLMGFYTAMGIPEKQLEAMRPLIEGGTMQSIVLWATPLWGCLLLGFFVYTKRYFVGRNGDTVNPLD